MFTTVSIMIMFILYKHYQQDKKICAYESTIKSSYNSPQLYSYCDDYIKTNKKILLEKNLLKQINILK